MEHSELPIPKLTASRTAVNESSRLSPGLQRSRPEGGPLGAGSSCNHDQCIAKKINKKSPPRFPVQTQTQNTVGKSLQRSGVGTGAAPAAIWSGTTRKAGPAGRGSIQGFPELGFHKGSLLKLYFRFQNLLLLGPPAHSPVRSSFSKRTLLSWFSQSAPPWISDPLPQPPGSAPAGLLARLQQESC